MNAETHVFTADRPTIAAFVEALFRYATPGNRVALRAFYDDKSDRVFAMRDAILDAECGSLIDLASDMATEAANAPSPIVFCPLIASLNPQTSTAKREDLVEGLAISVECDATPAAAQRKLTAFLGRPTVVAHSGGNWTNPKTGEIEPKRHLHWRLTEPATGEALARLREARRLAVKLTGADASGVPIVHPMRWPGSWHRKQAPTRATIAEMDALAEVDLDEALEALREATGERVDEEERPREGSGFSAGPDTSKRADDDLDVAAALAVIPNDDLSWDKWNRIGMAAWAACGGSDGGFAAFVSWSARSGKYDFEATAARWKHYRASPPTEIGAGSLFWLAAQARPGWKRPSLAGKEKVEDEVKPQDGPIPLFPEIEAGKPYPIEALGPILAPAALAIARKVKAPHSLAAQSVLCVGALAAQTHADVMMPYGQTRPLSIDAISINDSGDRKSTVDGEAMWPIKKFERNLLEKYSVEHEQWTYQHAAWAAEKKKIESDRKLDFASRKTQLATLGPEPLKPLAPWITADDVTPEGLAKAMIHAPASLGVFATEGGTFTNGHGMAPENIRRSGGTYSLFWDGQPVKRLRSLDGTMVIPGRRVSMHLLIQSDAAADFLSNAVLRDQGLLSRILVAAGDSLAGTRFYEDPRPDDEAAIRAYGARILKILENPWPLVEGTRNELDPRKLPFSSEAKERWITYFNHVEAQCAKNGALAQVKDFAAKTCEHAARIAGILTIMEDVAAPEIGPEAMRNALTLMDHYLNEVVRLHRASRIDPALIAAQRLLEWMQERAKAEVTIGFRDLIRHGPNATRTKAAADPAIKKLIEHGWVRQVSNRPRMFAVIQPEGAE